MRKSLLLLSFSVSLANISSFGQFIAGGGIALNQYGGDYKKLHPAIQPRIGYTFADRRFTVIGGFNVSPVKGKTTYSIEIIPESVTREVSMQNLFIHGMIRLGDPENKFHFKLIGGASMDFISIKHKTDPSMAYLFPDEKTNGPKLDFGIGGDYTVGNGDVYFELLAALPANQTNGTYISNPTVTHVGISIGYQFCL